MGECPIKCTGAFNITVGNYPKVWQVFPSILRSMKFYYHILWKKLVLTFSQNGKWEYLPLVREILNF